MPLNDFFRPFNAPRLLAVASVLSAKGSAETAATLWLLCVRGVCNCDCSEEDKLFVDRTGSALPEKVELDDWLNIDSLKQK